VDRVVCVVALCALVVTGCGWPIDPARMPDVLQQLRDDQASACLWIGGRGGGGAGVLAVPTVPAGGYGSGELLLGRVNSPDTRLTIENGNCMIERGGK